MQIFTVAAALFVAIAGATEQSEQANRGELSWGGGRYRPQRGGGRGNFPYGGRGGGRGGRGRGRGRRYDGRNFDPNDGVRDYGLRDSCTCSVNGVVDPDVARAACNDLKQTWDNLDFDEGSGACYDDNSIGLEKRGWGAACQNNGPAYDQYNPAYVTSNCDPKSPQDYNVDDDDYDDYWN
ncbi:hypothetical protein CLAFUW4_04412 [Fulvia fulva]|uniref:Putative effector 38 n=1 Tax=Passalora fulva TaxID=5499 RepID=A0A1P8YXK6_PASFU|nr:uncharacterized protein CLAFUR5_04375 [Fulvia fulva]AQA29241.1 putative effector 38 [Fulvia fulva]KAK4627076.1 hypothetical protein CLAFUR4_04398 [Fulvia fulva]KAK4628443.1 hypothetical protein CLAFUR0_04400 [Fulvia fulva]UJO15746.1 hypothetical protein CLAFUR5_04375 [Fulvia fulva]WPV14199.1 hypothetical protein CLAFUW4_04412 [Fulvia fulva]